MVIAEILEEGRIFLTQDRYCTAKKFPLLNIFYVSTNQTFWKQTASTVKNDNPL